MNFSAVHGFNAYKQFTAQVREASKLEETQRDQGIRHEKAGPVFSEPVDVVSISRSALSRYQSHAKTTERDNPQEHKSPQTTLNEWIKSSGNNSFVTTGRTQNQPSGQAMAELLKLNGIALEENEVQSIDMDVWCAVSVTERNAEKAKAIQNLLHTTPSGINWGFLLQKLPVD